APASAPAAWEPPPPEPAAAVLPTARLPPSRGGGFASARRETSPRRETGAPAPREQTQAGAPARGAPRRQEPLRSLRGLHLQADLLHPLPAQLVHHRQHRFIARAGGPAPGIVEQP